jgi:hypothetical protein
MSYSFKAGVSRTTNAICQLKPTLIIIAQNYYLVVVVGLTDAGYYDILILNNFKLQQRILTGLIIF